MSFITGQRISTSQADRLAHSLESLDGRQFETDYIQQGIASEPIVTGKLHKLKKMKKNK